MSDWLKEWAGEKGYQAAWVDFALLDDARTTVDDLAASNLIDKELYGGIFKSGFRYRPEEGSDGLTSGIIVSVPRPHHHVIFEAGEGRFRAVLPATYLQYVEVREGVRRELRSRAEERYCGEQCRFERMSAPLKSVAARAGIVTFGRNNITYAEGCGSGHQLLGFFTNVRPDRAVEMLDPRETYGKAGDSSLCLHCEACVRACPTGALSGDRYTIRASRCMTYLNEYRGPWPDWLDPGAHNSLVGCMRCQEVCPRNKGHIAFELASQSFTREETEAILETADAGEAKSGEWVRPAGPIWESVGRKLAALGQLSLEPFIGRNLKALMGAEAAQRLP